MPKAKIKRLYLIPILSKALDIIELLEESHAPVSLEDVYQRTHISKTSVYRILKTLVHRDYVAHTQDGLYRLVSRPRRLRFGFATQSAEMPFSVAVAQSVTAAAAASGVELITLDNRYDPDAAIRNAEEFVARRVDLVLEFQVAERVAPRVAHIFKKADIPLIAIDVPHPHATYFGVDNFEVGYEAGRGMRQPSQEVVANFLRGLPKGKHILVAAATDSSALGVLDAARQAKRETDFAIAGQDCIPEVLEELRLGSGTIIGSISHESNSYGPRLIQLGISILRGYTVPPYNYVRHRVVTVASLLGEKDGQS